MRKLSEVKKLLSKAGYRTSMFQRAEVKELCNVLHDDEQIFQATNGYYEGGFSLLVATDSRLLLIDRKPMFLTLDSIAYSMIQEVSFNYRLLNSTIHIYTSNKCLDFSSWNQSQIRAILNHAQATMRGEKVQLKTPVEMRQEEQKAGEDTPMQKAYSEAKTENEKSERKNNDSQSTDEKQNTDPNMQYERLSVAEMDMEDVPTMPVLTPHYLNDNVQPTLTSSSTVNTLPIDPNDLSTGSTGKLASYGTPSLGQRHYVRRYF
jgi:hypothetical protein